MDNIETITLLFGGDFAPRGDYEALIAVADGAVFNDVHDIIERADFTLFNLEVPLCRDGNRIQKAGPAICAAPETLRALTVNGVDAVCLANNHIFDYGHEGLSQTLNALKDCRIRHVGAGLNRTAAETPLRVVLQGRRISIFSFAEREFNLSSDDEAGAALLDPLRMAPLLLAERSHADAMIVCVHGGNEYLQWPRPGLRRICRFLIEIGADAVIGHHPHVPGTYEILHGKPIFYSLGNLIFDTARPPLEWDQGYLVSLKLTFGTGGLERVTPELIPYFQSVERGGLQLMQGEVRKHFLSRIETMRYQLENSPAEWLAAWEDFVLRKQHQTFIDMSSPIRFPGLRRLLAFRPLRNLILPPSRSLHRLNLLRCESHRELLIAAMEKYLPSTAQPSKRPQADNEKISGK